MAQNHQISFFNLHFIATGSSSPLGWSGGKHHAQEGDGSKGLCRAASLRNVPIHAEGVFSAELLLARVFQMCSGILTAPTVEKKANSYVTSSFPDDVLSAAFPLEFPGL